MTPCQRPRRRACGRQQRRRSLPPRPFAVDESAFPPAKAWAVIQAHLPSLKGFKIERRAIRQGLTIRQHNPRAVAIHVAHAATADIAGLTAQLAALFQQQGYDTKYPVTDGPEGGVVLVALKLAPKTEAAVHHAGKRLTSGVGGTPAAEAARLKPEDHVTIDGHVVEIITVRSQQRAVHLFNPLHPTDPHHQGPLSRTKPQQVVTVRAYLLPLSLQQTKFTFYGPKPTWESADYVGEDIVWDQVATSPLTVAMYLIGPDKARGREIVAALNKSPDVQAKVRDETRGLLDVQFDTEKFSLGWDLRMKEFLYTRVRQRLHDAGITLDSRHPLTRPQPSRPKVATEATRSGGVGGFRLGHVGMVARPIPLPFPHLRKRRGVSARV